MLADGRRERAPRHRIARKGLGLFNQNLGDQFRLGNEDDVIAHAPEGGHAFLVGRARNRLEIIAKYRGQPAQPEWPRRRFERGEVGVVEHTSPLSSWPSAGGLPFS